MKNIAVYAGTFDPITYGHIDLIERATHLFQRVIIAIAENKNKRPLFTLKERVELTLSAVDIYTNVEVKGFDCLLLDFVKKNQANVILRGLRAVADFDYEFQLASMNRCLDPTIESLFLMPGEKYMYVSSSLVKEIASFGGETQSFVPPQVAKLLRQKFK